eukprot:PITA_02558
MLVEAILAKNATDVVVINFMVEDILSRFGCLSKIITNNAQVFKSSKFTSFCHKFNIVIGHSTAYYPQGNGLVESSNKTIVRVVPKRSTGKSPFELVYDKAAMIQLAMSVERLLQEAEEESSALTRRINPMVELHENKEQVGTKLSNYQQKMKSMFDKREKDQPLQPRDLVLRQDVQWEDKGKHGKFDPL